jgi:hypothetical protein
MTPTRRILSVERPRQTSDGSLSGSYGLRFGQIHDARHFAKLLLNSHR